MTIRKSDLIKKITLDMPIKETYCIDNEKTVGEFLENRRYLPGISFNHGDGIDYYLDYWTLGDDGELAFQVNNNSVEGCPKYMIIFSGKENFFDFVQYTKYLDGTFVYEDLIDWKKVKSYETFKPGWLK